MAVPKKKSSKSRTSRKHSINSKLKLPTLHNKSESGDFIQRHRMDPASGMYREKQVIIKKEG